MLEKRFGHIIGIFILLSLLAGPSSANSLLIWPIYPVIESHQQASALWLENRGSETVNMQVRIFAWSQVGGENQYQSQQSVVGSPPMTAIAPGERQMVRLIRQEPSPIGEEQAYRIIVDEIPALAPNSGGESSPRAAVQLQMRYSLPLFVYGEGALPPERIASSNIPYPGLTWRLVTHEGQSQLEIHNAGQHHVRLSQVTFEQPGQRNEVTNGLLGYVLPRQVRRWPLPQNIRPTGELRAHISGVSHRISAE
ncbi:fimbrial biogenesis chaperone [Vreelandella sp. 21]|uniref:fimbrial biogenesis chaperone n=1 Tax=Vreelandella sp. 21 TaxID=3402864 RepID=UPI003D9A8CB2